MGRVKGKVAITKGAAVPMREPSSIFCLVSYLASDPSGFVNEAEIVVDNAAAITAPTPTV
ncbi:MAG: short-chain dehydrogenase/reductase SDR [Gammaproteobacteria bacterium]|nr:short-chain dehydrogenase/reductase SDR [Gammaproteobacteria bacterium]